MLAGDSKLSRTSENYASRRWGSLRRKKGNSLGRDTGTLPRHLERGKNLSKRFRKSCRNWAASKGLIAQKPGKEEENKDESKDTTEDVVVIDLDEDPEIHYNRSSQDQDSDIGRLVADLVLDAKRRNTLPRSGSKHSLGKEGLDVPLAALENSKAVNEEAEDVTTAKLTSPSDLTEKSEDDSDAANVELKNDKKVVEEILETSFDEHEPHDEPSENLSEETSQEMTTEVTANNNEEAKDNITEVFESIGETLFYNGISLNNEFAVRATYSGELFKEETATSSGTSQLDQHGFTELSTYSNSANECLDGDINEKEEDDGKYNFNEDLCPTKERNHDESLGFIIFRDEEAGDTMEDPAVLADGSNTLLEMSASDEELTQTSVEEPKDDLHTNESLSLETSEHDFNSIAKISALDFLNDDESDEGEEEEDEMEENDLYQSYFGSSYMLSRRLFAKENSFPSLSVSAEDEEREAMSGSYLEAINLQLDRRENPWQNTGFKISSAEFRINPFYKEEDSLSNSLVLNSENQTPTFNYNFQEFFDLWEMFSQESKDDKPALTVLENSVGLCNLEAIQEEDETDEDSERDENNNYDDDDDSEYESDDVDEETMTRHDESSEPEFDIIDPPEHQRTLQFDGENAKLIKLEGEKNVTVDNSEKSVTVAVMCGDNAENSGETLDTDDNKLYEGLSVLFQSQLLQQSEDAPIEKDPIGFGESVEDYIESFFNSLILNIVSSEELKGSEYSDDIDDEYFSSCDSPIEDDRELHENDLHYEFGSDKGLSTDEGIDGTTDEDEESEDQMNKIKSKMELERTLISTKF